MLVSLRKHVGLMMRLTPGDRLERSADAHTDRQETSNLLEVTVATRRALIPNLDTASGLAVGRDGNVLETLGSGVWPRVSLALPPCSPVTSRSNSHPPPYCAVSAWSALSGISQPGFAAGLTEGDGPLVVLRQLACGTKGTIKTKRI